MKYIQERFLNKEISLLDVGCGNGRFLDSLENFLSPLSSEVERLEVRGELSEGERAGVRTYSYLGIDESSGMIDEAHKLHPDDSFKVLDMNHLEELSKEDPYDVIVFIASFHHLQTREERKEVLQKTKKLLKNGGVIMMTNWNLMGEPNFSKYAKSYEGNGDFQIKIGAHHRYYHGFTIEELEQLFLSSGYIIKENRLFDDGRNIISILSL